jgi:hypothetical protein
LTTTLPNTGINVGDMKELQEIQFKITK